MTEQWTPEAIADAARELDHLATEELWQRLRATEKELEATREYLHEICDAYEEWKKVCDESPDHEPSTEQCDAHDEKVGEWFNTLTDALDTACTARQEP